MPVKVILDTDIGSDIDDAYALAFALLRPELDVLAVTTVYGRTDLRSRLARQVAEACGFPDLPIGSGAVLPLCPVSPEQRRTLETGVHNQCANLDPDDGREFPDAIDLIAETVNAHPGEVALVTVGPETNLALAFERDPSLPEKLRYLSIMGGETHLLRPEHNILSDYVAAARVFRTATPKFLGTWEVTRRVFFEQEHVEQLRESDSAPAGLLAELTDLWSPHKGWKRGPVHYDMCPLLWLFAPSFFETQPMRVFVEEQGEYTKGFTVPVPGEPNVEVSTGIRGEEVRDLLLGTLLHPLAA
jgi:purine nucleosidase